MSGISMVVFENVSKTKTHCSIFKEPRMRKSYENHLRLNRPPIDQVQFNCNRTALITVSLISASASGRKMQTPSGNRIVVGPTYETRS